jgi:hypothetical protein
LPKVGGILPEKTMTISRPERKCVAVR